MSKLNVLHPCNERRNVKILIKVRCCQLATNTEICSNLRKTHSLLMGMNRVCLQKRPKGLMLTHETSKCNYKLILESLRLKSKRLRHQMYRHCHTTSKKS